MLDPHGALIYTMTLVTGAESRISKAEQNIIGDIVGQVFALLVLTVAAAEAAIGLAVLVVYFRNRGSIAVEDVNLMKG